MGLLDKPYVTCASVKSSEENSLLYLLSFKNMCTDLPEPRSLKQPMLYEGNYFTRKLDSLKKEIYINILLYFSS